MTYNPPIINQIEMLEHIKSLEDPWETCQWLSRFGYCIFCSDGQAVGIVYEGFDYEE